MNKTGKLIPALVVGLVLAITALPQNLKVEEILAKHLDSIAKPEKRAELTTFMALGISGFESRNPQVVGGGKAVVVSDPDNLLFIISLNSREYPYEKIGYFNGKPSLPFIASGSRSLLGTFVAEHESLLSSGVFGGAMTLRWNSILSEKNRSKLRSLGTKKVNGANAYVLDFLAQTGSGEFKVKLFFDAATFRHIRTEYRREIAVGRVIFGQQNQQGSAVATLTEDFSNFHEVAGVTLPYSYEVKYVSNSSSMSNENIWSINVAEYRLNQKLQPDFFTFDAK